MGLSGKGKQNSFCVGTGSRGWSGVGTEGISRGGEGGVKGESTAGNDWNCETFRERGMI